MIILTGMDLGADGLLVEGTDFKCNASICYGVGATHQTFIEMQKAINFYAKLAGFTPLPNAPGTSAPDGFIGAQTVAAAKKIVDYFMAGPTGAQSAAVIKTIAASPTKQVIAANAGKFAVELANTASALGLKQPVVAVAPAPASKPAASAAAPSVLAPAAAPGVLQPAAGGGGGGSTWYWWVLGIVALAGAGTIGYLVWRRRAKTEAPTAREYSRRSKDRTEPVWAN